MGNTLSYFWESESEEERYWKLAKNGYIHGLRNFQTDSVRQFLDWQHHKEFTTPLMVACMKGHLDVVKYLIQMGSLVNTQSRGGSYFTSLHYAAKYGQLGIVQYLLSLDSCNPLIMSNTGMTALDLARKDFLEENDTRLIPIVRILEEKLSVFNGWLYESTENAFSKVSQLQCLQSWHRRYCIVLRTSNTSLYELCMYGKSTVGVSCIPVTQLVFTQPQPIVPVENSKIFNSKPYSFVLTCQKKSENRSGFLQHPGKYEFAALDSQCYTKWANFFEGVMHSPQAILLNNSINPTAPVGTDQPSLSSSASPSAPPTTEEAIFLSDYEYAVALSKQLNGSSHAEITDESYNETSSTVNTLASSSIDDNSECVICFQGSGVTVCVPCGHNALCMQCADNIMKSVPKCPVCRLDIREMIRMYRV